MKHANVSNSWLVANCRPFLSHNVQAMTYISDFVAMAWLLQYAIVFKTPPYRDPSITEPVSAFLQLHRPSTNDFGDPKPFMYRPTDRGLWLYLHLCVHRRRRRGTGGHVSPPKKKKIPEKFFSGNFLWKIRAFFGKNHVKLGNVVIFFGQIS